EQEAGHRAHARNANLARTVALTVDAREAERIARERFGIEATATPLAGERDLNYRLQAEDGRLYVLKLHEPGADRAALELQDAAGAIDLLDDRRRALVAPVFARFGELDLSSLPRQLIHNDANEHNVLVAEDGSVAGLIDFGDLVWAPRVCGLAVALAYAMLGRDDPVRAVTPVVRGYHEVAPL